MKKLLFPILCFLFLQQPVNAQQQSKDSLAVPVQPQSLGWVQVPIDKMTGATFLSYPAKDTAFCMAAISSSTLTTGLRSFNGGLTWQAFSTPELWAMSFVDGQNGYAAGYTSHTAYRTSDGGQSWSSADDQDQIVTIVYPVTKDTCFLTGSNSISRTTDGGKTWSVRDLPANQINGIAFWDSKHGVVVCSLQPGPLPQHHEQTAGCFTTTDGGESWVQQFTGASSDFQAVGYSSPSVVLAVELLSKIRRSTDSGASWGIVDTLASAAHLYAISMHSKAGFVVGMGGAILHTSDTGVSWTVQTSGVTSDLSSIVALDDTLALASGNGGVILRTTNGGVDWVQISPPSPQDLQASSFPDPSTGPLRIGYSLPQTQDVTITVIDVMGRKVGAPLSGILQTAGPHSVIFDSSQLPVGMYTYQIQTERFQASGKFTIVK